MTKADLVEQIYQRAELPSKAKAEAVLEVMISSLSEAISSGDGITFSGFGSFKLSERAARKGRNPRTGKEIDIPACKVVKFTPGKNLKESIN